MLLIASLTMRSESKHSSTFWAFVFSAFTQMVISSNQLTQFANQYDCSYNFTLNALRLAYGAHKYSKSLKIDLNCIIKRGKNTIKKETRPRVRICTCKCIV